MSRSIPDVAREIEATDFALSDYVEERRLGMFLRDADHALITELMKQRNDLVDELTNILSDCIAPQSLEPGDVFYMNDRYELSLGGPAGPGRREFGHVVSTSFSEPRSGRTLQIVVYDARTLVADDAEGTK